MFFQYFIFSLFSCSNISFYILPFRSFFDVFIVSDILHLDTFLLIFRTVDILFSIFWYLDNLWPISYHLILTFCLTSSNDLTRIGFELKTVSEIYSYVATF